MEPPFEAWLEGMNGGLQGRRFELGDDEALIGRGSDCQIPLPDPLVSRRHAVIRRREGEWVLTDSGSAHGTWVNGKEIREARLSSGDVVRLGDTELAFRLGQDAIATILPAPPLPAASAPPGKQAVPASAPTPEAPGTGAARTPKKGRTALFACGGLSAAAACLCVAGLIVLSLTGGLGRFAEPGDSPPAPTLEVLSPSPAAFDPNVTYQIEEITQPNAMLDLFMEMLERDPSLQGLIATEVDAAGLEAFDPRSAIRMPLSDGRLVQGVEFAAPNHPIGHFLAMQLLPTADAQAGTSFLVRFSGTETDPQIILIYPGYWVAVSNSGIESFEGSYATAASLTPDEVPSRASSRLCPAAQSGCTTTQYDEWSRCMGDIYGHVGVGGGACVLSYYVFHAAVESGGAALPALAGFLGGCMLEVIYCLSYISDEPPTYVVLQSPRAVEGPLQRRCTENGMGFDLYPLYSMRVRWQDDREPFNITEEELQGYPGEAFVSRAGVFDCAGQAPPGIPVPFAEPVGYEACPNFTSCSGAAGETVCSPIDGAEGPPAQAAEGPWTIQQADAADFMSFTMQVIDDYDDGVSDVCHVDLLVTNTHPTYNLQMECEFYHFPEVPSARVMRFGLLAGQTIHFAHSGHQYFRGTLGTRTYAIRCVGFLGNAGAEPNWGTQWLYDDYTAEGSLLTSGLTAVVPPNPCGE